VQVPCKEAVAPHSHNHVSELREVFEMVTKQAEPDVDAWRDQERRQRRKSRNRKLGTPLRSPPLAW
jgi:hypothetical protein